jgi:hypothetical protein
MKQTIRGSGGKHNAKALHDLMLNMSGAPRPVSALAPADSGKPIGDLVFLGRWSRARIGFPIIASRPYSMAVTSQA